MNNKVTYQDLLWTALTPAGTNLTRWAVALAVVMIMLVMPQGTLAQTKYKIETDGNCEVYYYDFVNTVVVTEAEAGKELSVRVKADANPGSGKYFTGEFTLNGSSLGSTEWGYNEGFTMPAEAVMIKALQADKQTLSVDLTTTTRQEVPPAAALLFNGDGRLNYNDELGGYDVDNSGVADMIYYDVDGEHIYVQRLAGADATGTYTLSYPENTAMYGSISFVFPEPKKTVQSGWITVNVGEGLTYNGGSQTPAVTVNDGTKDITGEFEVTYSNNKNAGEATATNAPTVTVTAKTTSVYYTGNASTTFTIAPKPVTISGVKANDKVYDGATTADIDLTGATINGKVGNDEVNIVAGSAAFADRNAGEGKAVTFGGFTLTGAKAGNYTLSAQPASVTATIKPLTGITVTITGKHEAVVYDGTEHEVEGFDISCDNELYKVTGDDVDFAFSGKDVASRIDAGTTNMGLASEQFANVNNNFHAVLFVVTDGYVTIKPKPVTISGVKANDKVYDGTTTAVINTQGASIDGKVNNDELNIGAESATAAFADANAGEGKAVTFSGFTLTGAQAGNYTLSAQPASVMATINRKALELLADAIIIEGEAVPSTFTGSVTGFVEGEGLAEGDVLLFALSDPSACTPGSYVIIGTLNGIKSGNYGLNYTFSNAASNANAFKILAKSDPVNPEPEHQPEHVDLTPIGEPEVVEVTGSDGITTVTETTTYTDGSTSVKVTKIYPDGTEIVTLTLKVSNGIVYEETKVTNSDGSKIETESKTSTTTVENEDGSTTTTIEKTTKKTVTGADGYQTVTETKSETATTTVENEDGSTTTTKTTITTVKDAEGSVLETTETKIETLTDADGEILKTTEATKVTDADGNVITETITTEESLKIDPNSEEVDQETGEIFCEPTMEQKENLKDVISGIDYSIEKISAKTIKDKTLIKKNTLKGTNTKVKKIVAKNATKASIFKLKGKKGKKVKIVLSKNLPKNVRTDIKNKAKRYGIKVKFMSRGSSALDNETDPDDEYIESGDEIVWLEDCDLVLTFDTSEEDIIIDKIEATDCIEGDANNDGYLNAADLVEMINAKDGRASERFSLTNADIDRDGQITQADIDAVVKYIMKQTDEE